MRQGRKPKILSPAKAVVAPWLEKLGLNAVTLAVFEAWDRVSPSSRAAAAGFKGKTLYVDVDHSARLHDLTIRKPQLLKKLNEYLGARGAKAPVSDIICRISDDNPR